jgi:hypothetical protein
MSASLPPKWEGGARVAEQRRGIDSSVEEAPRPRNDTEYSARPLRRGPGAQPFDGMEEWINDAPLANEIMVAVAVTDSGSPLPSLSGLTIDEIKSEEGLR